MQELIDELLTLQVCIQCATREIHLKATGSQPDAKPMTVEMTYLIVFEQGKAPEEFAVQKKLDFRF